LIEKERDIELNKKLFEYNFNINDAFKNIMSSKLTDDSEYERMAKKLIVKNINKNKIKQNQFNSKNSSTHQTDLMDLGVFPKSKSQVKNQNMKKDEIHNNLQDGKQYRTNSNLKNNHFKTKFFNDKNLVVNYSSKTNAHDIIKSRSSKTKANHKIKNETDINNRDLIEQQKTKIKIPIGVKNKSIFMNKDVKEKYRIENILNNNFTKFFHSTSLSNSNNLKIYSISAKNNNSDFYSKMIKNEKNNLSNSNYGISGLCLSSNNFNPTSFKSSDNKEFIEDNHEKNIKEEVIISNKDHETSKNSYAEDMKENSNLKDFNSFIDENRSIKKKISIFTKDKLMLNKYNTLKENFVLQRIPKENDSSYEQTENKILNKHLKKEKILRNFFNEEKSKKKSYLMNKQIDMANSEELKKEKFTNNSHQFLSKNSPLKEKQNTFINEKIEAIPNKFNGNSQKINIYEKNKNFEFNSNQIQPNQIENEKNIKLFYSSNPNHHLKKNINRFDKNIENKIIDEEKENISKNKFEFKSKLKESLKKDHPSAFLIRSKERRENIEKFFKSDLHEFRTEKETKNIVNRKLNSADGIKLFHNNQLIESNKLRPKTMQNWEKINNQLRSVNKSRPRTTQNWEKVNNQLRSSNKTRPKTTQILNLNNNQLRSPNKSRPRTTHNLDKNFLIIKNSPKNNILKDFNRMKSNLNLKIDMKADEEPINQQIFGIDEKNRERLNNIRVDMMTPQSNKSSLSSKILLNSITKIEKKTNKITKILTKKIENYKSFKEIKAFKILADEVKNLPVAKKPKSARHDIIIASSVEEKKKNFINLSENRRNLLKIADFIEGMNEKIILKFKNEIEQQYNKSALKNGLISIDEVLEKKFSKILKNGNELEEITIKKKRMENSLINARAKIEEKYFTTEERENFKLKYNEKKN